MESTTQREEKFQYELVNKLCWVWIIVNFIVMASGIIIYPEAFTHWIINIIIVTCIALAALTLNSFGQTRIAAYVLPLCMFLHITRLAYIGGGTILPGITNYIPIILTAGFLLGRKKGFIMAVLCIAVTFGIAFLQTNGMLPEVAFIRSPLGRAIAIILPVSIAAAIQYVATRQLNASLVSLEGEILKRKEVEVIKDQTVYNLNERVKELETLYTIGRILDRKHTSPERLLEEIVETIPKGWQFPSITGARICIGDKEYVTGNYRPSEQSMMAEMNTLKGTRVSLEVVYIQTMPEIDEGPFLKEERSLINMLLEMLKIDLEQRERNAELNDYKYALDIASIVSIIKVDGSFSFVNENFCKISQYTFNELIGKQYDILWSCALQGDYFTELQIAMQHGKPFRGEFCSKAKDGTTHWVDTTIVPFLDENGKVYQYLSISHNITERKEAEEQIIQSEQLLKKITSQVPGNTYMFEIEESGESKILFSNRGTDALDTPSYIKTEPMPLNLSEALYEADKDKFNQAMKEAYRSHSPISVQYRVVDNGQIRWHWMQATAEKDKNDKMTWYGATSDITPLIDYIATIEQVLFDISHVIRRPIATMLGMTKLVMDNNFSEKEIKDISKKLYQISAEMDKFLLELNNDYQKKKEKTNFGIDFNSSIDKRNSLFN